MHTVPISVNLLCWSLKLKPVADVIFFVQVCKFTPLEFETCESIATILSDFSVNLLRWSLKPLDPATGAVSGECKFTPLEFETFPTR